MHGEVVPDFMSIRLPTLDKLSDFKPMLDIWAARAQAWNGKPIVFAAVYAVISAIASWAFGESFLMALFGGILAFVYCAGFFWLVDRYRDDVSKPLGILLSGAAVLLILAFT